MRPRDAENRPVVGASRAHPMRRRIVVELVVGAVLVAAAVAWVRVRPTEPAGVLAADDPKVRSSIAAGRERVLLVGVDAMTWTVALDLVNRGRMPVLAGLLAASPHGVMHAPEPIISPVIWTTMATGQPPEVHGIDNFLARAPGSYAEVTMTTPFRKVPALWNMVSWGGRTVAVVNWYATGPAEAVNGPFVAHNTTPDTIGPATVTPEPWVARLRDLPLEGFPDREAAFAALAERQAESAFRADRFAFTAARHAMTTVTPDLTMVYLPGVDMVSHLYWKYRWPAGLDHSFAVEAGARARLGGVVEDHYEFVDRLLGMLIRQAPGATVIVVSDHGHGPTFPPHNLVLLLNQLLARLGELRWVDQPADLVLSALVDDGQLRLQAPAGLTALRLSAVLQATQQERLQSGQAPFTAVEVEQWLRARPEAEVGQPSAERLEQLRRSLDPARRRSEVLWPETRVFNVDDSHLRRRGLHFNLAGREANGAVPRARYGPFRGELIRRLTALTTEDGTPLFDAVVAHPEAGPEATRRPSAPPDVVVELNRNALLAAAIFRRPDDPNPIPMSAVRWEYPGSGDHTPDGLILIAGPSTRGYRRVDATPLDIAPTVLWRLGYPVGADMPGRVLTEAFADDSGPVLRIPSWTAVVPAEPGGEALDLRPEDRERLRELGYVAP